MQPVDYATSDEFVSLYREHHGWLVQMLHRRLGGADAAADLAHDTFERVMRSRSRLAFAEPRGFLTTVAKRLLIDQSRRKAIEQAYLETLAARADDVVASPEMHVLVVEALEAVCRMMEQLPARARQVFVLAQVEGLTYPEVSERLGVSVQAVQRDMVKAWQHCYGVLYA
ncbi:sigma-70 family RNA polymerase sigma factor [Bordetella holmesii]|uniref:ECF sigma factor n=2 Tax=Bordetella holmesii TaxID=35814 RepID=A0A158M2Y4_9BORD|nr:sigma-70 family RNA polymerase sigma factor [Bordetella holmesii]AHV93161.1 RNA polymerase sigma factor, sigma-70 family protein [Bordetella holmesii ATCC 51541]AIT25077.1 RNA polymerase sigma factor, sigma-70 family protein [Bordetella holmesii 44057]EWM48642.1 RNA polymerase sigma factor, sigma-70 family protein [Bordetella holmesii 41130]EWM49764.1 RNA polymerase sigma factor, sigma-70 family protein [Bordetella holmesii 35009]AMD44326.1 RNA polymerase subunit sigma [Bordetella holmesii 